MKKSSQSSDKAKKVKASEIKTPDLEPEARPSSAFDDGAHAEDREWVDKPQDTSIDPD